jgi:hypothetical protein
MKDLADASHKIKSSIDLIAVYPIKETIRHIHYHSSTGTGQDQLEKLFHDLDEMLPGMVRQIEALCNDKNLFSQ